MKAIVQDRYGSPDVLRLTEVEQPVPADDEVLVHPLGEASEAIRYVEIEHARAKVVLTL